MTIETLAGIKGLKLNFKNKYIVNITVDMGMPILKAKDIPVVYDEETAKQLKIKALDKEFIFNCVSMGNPHAICFMKDIEKFNIEKYGPILENDKHFPEKSNIEFIKVLDRNNIKMRVWERGAGETLACGTGACASVVAGVQNNYIERKTKVNLKGGPLFINWSSYDNHIYMTGPATTVYKGKMST